VNWPSLAALVAVAVIIVLLHLVRRRVSFTARTLVALPLGVGLGVLFQGDVEYVEPIGTIYVNALMALVAPLIVISILSSVSTLGSAVALRRIGLRSVGWLVMSTVIAIVLTLGAGLALGVGRGADLGTGGDVDTDSLRRIVRPFSDVIVDLFPQNVVGDLAEGKVIPVIIVTLLFAIAYASVAARDPETVEPVARLLEALRAIIYRVVGYVIALTPYAVLALTAVAVSNAGDNRSRIWSLAGLLLVSVALCAIDAYLVNAVLLRVVADVNPVRWFRLFLPAQTTAFTTQSSIGTLPVTTDMLTRRIGVPREIAGFTAPLGATIGMPGCTAIWPLLVAIWGINATGMAYDAADYALLALLCLIVSLGTAGVPGTATITTTTVLAAAGLPLEFLALTLPISTVADMARTLTNVTAAGVVSTIVARQEGRLDDAVFAGRAVPEQTAVTARPEPVAATGPASVPAHQTSPS